MNQRLIFNQIKVSLAFHENHTYRYPNDGVKLCINIIKMPAAGGFFLENAIVIRENLSFKLGFR